MRAIKSAFIVILLVLSGVLNAQIAPVYKKFGFEKPAERAPKTQAKHTKRRSVRVSPPTYAGVKTTANKPQAYDINLTVLNEHDQPLKIYPRIRYELVQGTATKKNRTLLTDYLSIDAAGRARLSVTVKDPKFQAGVVFHLEGQSDEDPEFEFVDPAKAAIHLPAVKSPSSKPVATKPTLLKIRRNFADLIVKGIPPGCRVLVGGNEVSVKRLGENNDRVQISLPTEVAVNRDLQLNLVISDEQIERRATVDAGELLAGSGQPVSPYTLNSFEVPDEDWVIARIGLQGVPLADLRPEFGGANELALFTEAQVLAALGKPDRTEQAYAFSRPDGSEWLHYASKGLSVKVREISIGSGKSLRVVELVKLTSPSAGKIGGVGAGDAGDLLYNRLGKGQLSELFGKPRAGYRAYLSQGLQYSVDPATSLVASVEAWRPFALLMQAAVPRKMPLTNRIKIDAPTDPQWAGKDDPSRNLAAQTAVALRAIPSLRIVDNPLDADAILSWTYQVVVEENGKTVVRGRFTLVKAEFRQEADFEASASGLVGGSIAEQAMALMNAHLDCLTRVESIDYLTGELSFGVGRKGGLAPGFVFDPMNLDAPAFPDAVDLTKAKTKLPKDPAKAGKAQVVILCTEAGDDSAVGKLAYLVRSEDGKIAGVFPLEKEDWPAAVRRLLDPGTGLVYGKLRLLPPSPKP